MYDDKDYKFEEVNFKFRGGKNTLPSDDAVKTKSVFSTEEAKQAASLTDKEAAASDASTYVRKRRSRNSKKPASDYFFETYGKKTAADSVIYDDSADTKEGKKKKKEEGTTPDQSKKVSGSKHRKKKSAGKKIGVAGVFSKMKPNIALSKGKKAGISLVLILLLIGVGVFLYWDRKPPELTSKELNLTYGSSVKVDELVKASDNRDKEVTLTIDSVSPTDGATISEDGKSISFEKVGSYNMVIIGEDDFHNQTTLPEVIEIKDATAPEFVEYSESYNIAYGKEVTIVNTYAGKTSSANDLLSSDTVSANASSAAAATDTGSSQEASAESSTDILDASSPKGAINTESSEETQAATEGQTDSTEETYDTITIGATDEITANVTISIASLKPLENQGQDSYTMADGKLIFNSLGDYEATIQAIDEGGNSQAQTINIHVIDKTAPEFTSIKDSYERPYGKKVRAMKKSSDKAKENDIKVKAKDEKSSVSVAITKVKPKGKLGKDSYSLEDGTLIMKKMGSYEVTITAKDESDNKVTKTVTIKTTDGLAPEFSGIPDSIHLTTDDTSYNWTKGVKAVDEVDGNISNYIEVDDSEVKFGKAGTYTITYSVADTSNNVATKSINVKIEKSEKASTAKKNDTQSSTSTQAQKKQ